MTNQQALLLTPIMSRLANNCKIWLPL